MRKDLGSILGVATIAGAAMLAPVAVRADHDLSATAERAEKLSTDFSHRFAEEMDKLVIDGRDEEQRFNELSERLRSRLDEVHHKIKEADDSDAKKKLDGALEAARQLNEALSEYAFSPALQDTWSELRSDLNQMALHFGLAGLPALAVR